MANFYASPIRNTCRCQRTVLCKQYVKGKTHTKNLFLWICFFLNYYFNFILFRFLSSISLLCFVINQSNLLKVPCCIGNSNNIICLRAKHLKISCVERKGLKFDWAKLHRKIKLFAAMCTLKWSGSRISTCHISRCENFIIFRS